jgi:hypothetical protein
MNGGAKHKRERHANCRFQNLQASPPAQHHRYKQRTRPGVIGNKQSLPAKTVSLVQNNFNHPSVIVFVDIDPSRLIAKAFR